jgi:hypothetical protein
VSERHDEQIELREIELRRRPDVDFEPAPDRKEEEE